MVTNFYYKYICNKFILLLNTVKKKFLINSYSPYNKKKRHFSLMILKKIQFLKGRVGIVNSN